MKGQGTIVATGAIGYPPGLAAVGAMVGAEKVMTMTSTYDHRIIQGAESGQFLQVVEAYLQGEHDFYEQVFADLGVELGAAPPSPAPAAAAAVQRDSAPEPEPSGAADEALLQAVQAATSLLKAHRMHGHLAARLDPLGSEPEGDPALDPETVGLTPELMARIPAKILRTDVPGATLADALPHLRETYCGTIAYEIEHIASHRQRTWLREKIESGAYRTPLTTTNEGLHVVGAVIEAADIAGRTSRDEAVEEHGGVAGDDQIARREIVGQQRRRPQPHAAGVERADAVGEPAPKIDGMRADQDLRDPAVAEQRAKTAHDLPLPPGPSKGTAPPSGRGCGREVRIGA